MDDIFCPKSPFKRVCKFCDYTTCNKKDFNRHLTTRKHKRMTTELQVDDVLAPQETFICGCGSEYKYRQGLWKHKKKCVEDEEIHSNEGKPLTFWLALAKEISPIKTS